MSARTKTRQVCARSVEEPAFVNTDEYAVCAKSVADVVFASMGGDAIRARSVQATNDPIG